MHSYKDKKGDQHTVDLDIPTAERLRDECGFDLLACLVDASLIEPMFQQLTEDFTLPIQLLAVIEDTDQPEEFGRLFDGQAITDAGNALVREIIDFFRDPQRSILRALHEKTMAVATDLVDTSTAAAMDAINDPAFSTAVRNLLTPGNGANESSQSSATTAVA